MTYFTTFILSLGVCVLVAGVSFMIGRAFDIVSALFKTKIKTWKEN